MFVLLTLKSTTVLVSFVTYNSVKNASLIIFAQNVWTHFYPTKMEVNVSALILLYKMGKLASVQKDSTSMKEQFVLNVTFLIVMNVNQSMSVLLVMKPSS